MSEITHTGTITAIKGNKITLLLSSAACGSCALRSACGPASHPDRKIDIETPEAKNFSVGQTVEVMLTQTQTVKAAFWGYIAPLILMLSALFSGLAFCSETCAAALSLGSLPVYYFILWLCRGKLKKTLQIKIR